MTSKDDVISLLDFAHGRLQARLVGVTAEELAWQPTEDENLSLRWRLKHIVETLGAARNPLWLGVDADAWPGTPVPTAQAVASAYQHLRTTLQLVQESELAKPVGSVGGRFASDSRFAFALHLADELIHHGAEAGLLRDLYELRSA